MKNIYLFAIILAFGLAACGETKSPEEQTSAPETEEATAEDIKLVEETKSVKVKVHNATEKADSILNAL